MSEPRRELIANPRRLGICNAKNGLPPTPGSARQPGVPQHSRLAYDATPALMPSGAKCK